MNKTISYRIESLDILRGLVMVIMALDHVRDYFHAGAFVSDPSNLDTTTPELFFTRFITHFCAPVFVFLAGTSAFLYGRNKTKKTLFKFLFTRGVWLILLELTVMTFLWWFDLSFSFFNLQVIWAIGLCMVFLSAIIYLPKNLILILGLVLVFGHNLLDGFTAEGNSFSSMIWYILHQPAFIQMGDTWISFLYPIMPWIGVMSLGYVFGTLYGKEFDPMVRKKWLLILGLGAIGLFLLLRGVNIYGDRILWSTQEHPVYTLLSFFQLTKYPPSLLFLLITLGPSLLFLLAVENIKNKITDFFVVYGRVPLFYYVIHVLVIHVAAILGILITGGDWTLMILTMDSFMNGSLAGYGYSLGLTYLIWMGIVAVMYPICLRYMKYKAANRDKKWLSYL
ncbi:MAG: heparan-alpha-glucosaminide N-acetyltransferase domain-containing protein [Bacteroidota bacterium]